MSSDFDDEKKPIQERRSSYDFQFTARHLNSGSALTQSSAGSGGMIRSPKINRDWLDNFLTVVNRELLFCKLFYFFFFGAFGSLFPLLAIYFKQLGMNASQSGVLIGFRPFIEFLSVPFWTGLADRWRRGKEMLLFALLSWVVFTLAIVFVQPPAHKCLVYNGTHTILEIPYGATARKRRDLTSFPGLSGGDMTSTQEISDWPMKSENHDPINSTVEISNWLMKSENLTLINEFVRATAMDNEKNNKYLTSDKGYNRNKNAATVKQKQESDLLSSALYNKRNKRAYHHELNREIVANVDPAQLAGLITSRLSNVVYKEEEVSSDFLILLIIVVLGEFFSAPAITFADCVTLCLLGDDTENYGRQRMFGSLGWGLAMFFVGMSLDHATTFPRHPCGVSHPAEKNYTVCFAVFSVLMACAFLTALQFEFHFIGGKSDILLSDLPKKIKKKVKRTVTGQRKIDRKRLVEEESDDENGGSDYVHDQYGRNEETETQKCDQLDSTLDEKNAPMPDHKMLKINTSWKNDMVTDALRAPGSSSSRLSRVLPATGQTGLYSNEPFFGKWQAAVRLLWSYQYLSVLFIAWFMGFGIGVIFTFLFWHLQDLGGSPTLFGVAAIINHMSELLAYFMCSRLLTAFGHVKVLYAGLVGNVIRFLYISWLREPYWVLPFEFVQGLTHAAVWASACAYVTHAIPPDLKSSAQGLLQVLHHGLGRGCGAVFGGLMVHACGGVVTFRVYGVSCIVVLAVYAGTNYYLEFKGRFSHKPRLQAGADRCVNDGTCLAPHGVPSGVTSKQLTHDNYSKEYGTVSHTGRGNKADMGGTTGYHGNRGDHVAPADWRSSRDSYEEQKARDNTSRRLSPLKSSTYPHQSDNIYHQPYGP